MLLYTNMPALRHEMECLCRVFYPFEKIAFVPQPQAELHILVKEDAVLVQGRVGDTGVQDREALEPYGADVAAARALYRVLCTVSGIVPKWGVLTGVRPAKLMHRIASALGREGAVQDFQTRLLVSPEKAQLASEVMTHENRLIALSKPDSFSLYIAIPFCPTRCAYCSFVSHSVEAGSAKKLVEPYVELLVQEIAAAGEIARSLGLRLETVYFGGGTPTTLSAEQLSVLFAAVRSSFDLSHLREYTVEAGRPDTITRDKLMAIQNAGVARISINPQSFSDRVLQAIGRAHTPDDTLRAFELARACGFSCINMDLIAGLPEDDPASFANSVDTAICLGAENITVHTLAVKTASFLAGGGKKLCSAADTDEMVSYSAAALRAAGYYPYYMYRQSKSVGNLENVGWCKPDMDSLYNVYMMDETHSVFGCGAGAVTKLRAPGGAQIERIYNFKYPYEYISRFDEMLQRKARISEFYEEYK